MPQYLIGSGLPSYPSGLKDENAALVLPIYRAVNSLAQQLANNVGEVQLSSLELSQTSPFDLLLNSRTNKLTVRASVALSFGKLVHLTETTPGIIDAVLADQATSLAAHGVVDTIGGIAAGSYGQVVFMSGRTQGITGATFGTAYYLGAAGAAQNAPPGTGLVQKVGVGLGSGGFYLNIIQV